MGAPTSVATASGHQLSMDHKKGKAKMPTQVLVTSKGNTAHEGTTAVVSSELSRLVQSSDSQTFSSVTGGRKPAVKRKAHSNGPRESLPGSEARRPSRPRKKTAGTSPASSQLGFSGQMTKDLTTEPPVNALGHAGVPMSSGLGGTPTALNSECLSAAMSMPALPPSGILPKDSEAGPGLVIPELCAQGSAKSIALDATLCENCSSLRCNSPKEGTNQLASDKLKLRLFPLDDQIKKGFEQDGRNPHLELTLKARKHMSSVIRHLVRKWGPSTVASGELLLFPFNAKSSNMSACQSWNSEDLNVTAADVHAAVGSPAVFRLRYAWLPSRVVQTSSAVLQQQELPASRSSEPVLPENACHLTRIDSVTQRTSVTPEASPPHNVCFANPKVMSTDPCSPVQQIPPFSLSEDACRNEDGGQSAIPFNLVLGSDAQREVDSPGITFNQPVVGKSRRAKKASPVGAQVHSEVASVPPGLDLAVPSDNILRVDAQSIAFKQPVLGKSRRAKKAPAVSAALQSDTGLVPPALDIPIFSGKDSENVDQSTCEALENTNPAPDCAWQCESNDGYAGQLWNCEDTFRSICGPSTSQMEWVDSLPDLSEIELLGEDSRAVCSAPLHNLEPSGQIQLNCVDSTDIEMGGEELVLQPSTNPSAAIFCGEDTCDAFSFQSLDHHSKDIVNSICEEFSGSLPGFDTSFPDVQDLLFDGEVSTGFGGLMAALIQESLDEFQACTVSNDAAVPDLDEELRFHGEVCGLTRESNAKTGTELSGTDLFSNENSEPNTSSERLPEATLPSVNTPSQDMEPLKASRTLNMRNKQRFPPQRLFMLPGQYAPS